MNSVLGETLLRQGPPVFCLSTLKKSRTPLIKNIFLFDPIKISAISKPEVVRLLASFLLCFVLSYQRADPHFLQSNTYYTWQHTLWFAKVYCTRGICFLCCYIHIRTCVPSISPSFVGQNYALLSLNSLHF